MPKIPDDFMQELRSRVNDCSVVAGWLCLRGRNRRWFCPSCQNDKSSDPTLSTPVQGGFACHKCEAKGDALKLVALTRNTSTRGHDFIENFKWLASQAGMGDVTGMQAKPPPFAGLYCKSPDGTEVYIPPDVPSPPVNEGRRLSSDDAAAVWAECTTHKHPRVLARLAERGIPANLIRSGAALLDDKFVHELSQLTTLGPWLRKHIGAAIVAPLRSAATSKVGALHVRAFNPSDGEDKRRTCGQKSDEDGTPRGYGLIGDVCNAQAIVLVEGMADTFAAEALLYSRHDVVIVGVDSITAFPAWAQWINAHNPSARVVIVRHIDGGNAAEHKEKAKQVRVARETLGARASYLSWAALANAIDAHGLPSIRSKAESGGGFDINDAVGIVTDNGKAHHSHFETLAAVLINVAGLPIATPNARANSMAAYINDMDNDIAKLWGNE